MNNDYFLSEANLKEHLAVIEKIFETDKILNEDINLTKIQKYYRDSNFGYNLAHSKEGSVHMAINYDGVFHEDGYYEQVKEIDEIIKKKEARVLELGCGKGFNSKYLAERNPNIGFQGIDVTERHLKYAAAKSKEIENLTVAFGDFHELQFNDQQFDYVFELESVCHSDNPEKVLSEVHRVLQPGGKFILFEGFRTKNFDHLSPNQKKASYLIEKTMGVNNGHNIEEWLKIAEKIGFEVEVNDDISEAIMPNLSRFHRLAGKYFKRVGLAKVVYKIMSKNLIKNTIAGWLMPFSIMQGMQSYNRIILLKK
ncbi:MAG: class I SAM-dependent methyltransferase [Flavobacteriales bacterium]|jgi:ubiquinone/menaquinone biosynthesis C-methylase UbiE